MPEVAPANGSGRPSPVSSHFFPRDEYFMRLALREASRAPDHDDVPLGAVIVRDGEVIAAARNERALRAISSPARFAYSAGYAAGLSCSGKNVAVRRLS